MASGNPDLLENGEFDFLWKVVLIGDSPVGKSQLLASCSRSELSLQPNATIGLEFGSRTIVVDNKTIIAGIWDLAGPEHLRFEDVHHQHLRATDGAMLVYDIAKQESFDHVPRWLEELLAHADANVVIMLIGNQADSSSSRQVSTAQAQEFAEKEGLLGFQETSAMESTNLENTLSTVLSEIYDTKVAHNALY